MTRLQCGFHDECGIFGVFRHPEAARITYLGLYALQHRGQESAGIVSADNTNLYAHRGMGYVADVFSPGNLDELVGDSAIGHVRYSTQGGSHLKNAQPVAVSCWRGALALSHNGNLVNGMALRSELERKGSIFQTQTDSEVIMHLIAKSEAGNLEDAIADSLRYVKGAYSLILLANNKLVAVRDPNGFRPLVLGKLGESFVLASETTALDLIGARLIRDVQPGEMLVIQDNSLQSYFPVKGRKSAFCIFELIYFARPDSQIFGQSVYEVRKRMGNILAEEHPVAADIVVPVPDSGIVAAIGYSEYSGIPFEMGLIRNHYVGRTFIEPRQSIRDFGVKLKLNPVRSVFEGKRVVIVDDSIVRGTTSRKLIRIIRSVGAAEVHVRISSPPIIGTCSYGIDTPTLAELIATRKSLEEICRFVEADSLGYLSIDGLLRASQSGSESYCTGCFSGTYPLKSNKIPGKQTTLFDENNEVKKVSGLPEL